MSVDSSHYQDYPQITNHDIWGIFSIVIREQDLQNEMGNNYKLIIKQTREEIQKNIRKIVKRINSLITKSNGFKKNKFVKSISQIYEFLEITDNRLIKNAFESYYNPVPAHAYKYVESDYAEELISNGWIKCGTASEYRNSDPDEMKTLLLGNTNYTNFTDRILSKITNRILEEKGISIDKIVEYIDNSFSSIFYICCVTDQRNSEYMWHEYGGGKNGKGGICMKLDISQYPFHYVTYSDAPIESKYVLNEWNLFCQSILKDSSDYVYDNYLSYTKNVLPIELLNLFRKNIHNKAGEITPFALEHEIRYLTDDVFLKSKTIKSGQKLYFMEANVLEVISDLPESLDKKIRWLCEEKNIKYERRRV